MQAISAHFGAAIPNFKVLEVDVDDVPWKDEIVTVVPRIENRCDLRLIFRSSFSVTFGVVLRHSELGWGLAARSTCRRALAGGWT